MTSVYDIIGEEGFEALARSFYAQVPGSALLAPMYPADDLEGAELRLRDFLVGRFGGPQRYIEQRGHPRLRMRHAPFPIGTAAREEWMRMMNVALDEAALAPEVARVLRGFFAETSAFLMNRADPAE